MSIPYSNDLRERIVESIKCGMAVKCAISIYKVKKSAIYQWLNRERETGSCKSYNRNPSRKESLYKHQG